MEKFARRSGLVLLLILFANSVLMVDDAAAQNEKIKLSATYQVEQGTNHGWLIVNAEIPEGSYIYALTQKGTPPPTKLKVAKSGQFSLVQGFQANKKPIVIENDPIFQSRVEKHKNRVRFLAPMRIVHGINVERLHIDLKFNGQLCSDFGCLPLIDKPVKVKFDGYYVGAPTKNDW